MACNKKDLEIIYNLQWKNSSGHGDDKANIVGMYDIPATTLNWETFKSYLLKNSGATGDDVKVYYINSEDKEFCIESQLDFQLALYSFRQKARNGDIINLRLDRVCDQNRMGRIKRLRRSAEPRLEEERRVPVDIEVALHNDNPPDWFKKYMKGFKKEIVEEVATSVMNQLPSTKLLNPLPQYCYQRKAKMECCKRPKKVSVIIGKSETDHRSFIKSMKLERKLDCKLEKLEQKTMKIKEKKLALMRSNDEENRSGSSKSRPIGLPLSDAELFMDASSVGQHELAIPHMSGGETYQQEWQVVNTGDLPWTGNTELRYAWGSEALKPLEKSVSCPPLNPGEKGVVSIYLEIPKKAGFYESYWHFYHEGRRFGHWLGCRVFVEPPLVKLSSPPIDILTPENEQSVLLRNWPSTPKKLENEESKEFDPPNIDDAGLNKFCSLSVIEDLQEEQNELRTKLNEIKNKFEKGNTGDDPMMKFDEMNVAAELEDLKLYDSNSSSDSDNQSIISIADSNSSTHSPSDEFVVVPIMSECLDGDEKTDVEEKKLSSGNLCIPVCSNIKLEKIDNSTDQKDNTVTKDDNGQNSKIEEVKSINESGYAYVNVDGQKIAVPKYLLRTDYLATAEEAPSPPPLLLNMLPLTASSPTPTIDSLAPTINTSTTPSIIMPKEENKDVTSLDNSSIRNPEESQISEQESISNSIKNANTECPLENGENCMNSSRVFMFPSNIPGFEVFPTPKSFAGSLPTESHISNNATNQSSNVFNDTLASSFSHPSGQFYQYGYCSSPKLAPAATENMFGYSYSYPYSHYRYPYPASWYNLSHPLMESNKMLNKYPHLYYDYREPHHNMSCIPSQEVETNEVMNESLDMTTAGTKASSPIQPVHPLHAAIPIETCKRTSPVTILPNTLVSGAVNVASSAINTARSVINMFSPPARQQEQLQEPWEDESWTSKELNSPREKALRTLHEMGFWDLNLNKTLLTRYNNDLTRVITELLNK